MNGKYFASALSIIAACCFIQPVTAAEPTSEKISTFAPAENLVAQADAYIKSLVNCTADADEYKDSTSRIAYEANTLIVIALALGLHDQDNKYKASAGEVIKAAQAVAAAKDFASAQKAVETLTSLKLEQGGGNAGLRWQKIAAQPELMKQVPIINVKLGQCLKPDKFQKKAKTSAGYTAVLAVIGHASIYDATAAGNDAGKQKLWVDFSAAMRDAAGELNAAIRKSDLPSAVAAEKKLTKSCDDCHAVFKPDAKK